MITVHVRVWQPWHGKDQPPLEVLKQTFTVESLDLLQLRLRDTYGAWASIEMLIGAQDGK